jgi:hypothetical protein
MEPGLYILKARGNSADSAYTNIIARRSSFIASSRKDRLKLFNRVLSEDSASHEPGTVFPAFYSDLNIL